MPWQVRLIVVLLPGGFAPFGQTQPNPFIEWIKG